MAPDSSTNSSNMSITLRIYNWHNIIFIVVMRLKLILIYENVLTNFNFEQLSFFLIYDGVKVFSTLGAKECCLFTRFVKIFVNKPLRMCEFSKNPTW